MGNIQININSEDFDLLVYLLGIASISLYSDNNDTLAKESTDLISKLQKSKLPEVEPQLQKTSNIDWNIENILGDILFEREQQDAKWGEQNHDPILWCAILGEEVGEVNKAALEARVAFNNSSINIDDEFDVESFCQSQNYMYKSLREELIQVASVAIAFIESLDRNQLAGVENE